MNLQEINQESDMILQVYAESMSSKWVYSKEGRNIVTSTIFRVVDCIKGDLRRNDVFTLELFGGKVGDTSQLVTSSVSFFQGEESILFLQKNPVCVTGGFQGKYPIVDGNVFIGNQKVKSTRFAGILKESKTNPQAIPAFLKEIRMEPMAASESNPQSGVLKSLKSTTDTYAVSGIKSNFIGGTDSDADGYFETYTFQIQINGDAVPGPATVYFKINCTTTSQSWTSINSYIITGSTVDYNSFSFDQSDFTGLITSNTELNFTVDLLDATKTTVLATDATVDGDIIKADIPAVPVLTISSISPDIQSAGTNRMVTLNGTSFGATQGTGKVEFFYRDGQPKIVATILNWSDTQIVCTVPTGSVGGYSGSAGSGPVTVTNNAGQTSGGYPFRVTFGVGGPKWATSTVRYRINENLSGVTGEGQSIQNAANTWTAANANFQYVYDGPHTNVTNANNGHNDLVWGTVESPSTIGQASIWYSGSTIIECDIIFNQAFAWNSGPSVPSGTIDIETIALHELGHWLNLRDLYGNFGDGVYDQSKALYGFSSYGQSKRVLHADDIGGIQWIYGLSSSVSISGYVKTGGGTGVANVVLNGLPGSPQTNASGYYSVDVPSGWTGTVTPVKAGYTFTLASHNYSNLTTNVTNQDFTATALNNDATLSDLKISGTTVAGFSKTQLSYSFQLPFGTTAVPTVTATTTDAGASKIITPSASLPGSTTVRVTAQDGTTILTYTVNFTLAAASADATLSDLKAGGVTVSGFSPSIYSYAIILPHGTTAVPAVTATTTHSGATKVITPAVSLPGTTNVLVTAQDGISTKTYSVNFTVAKDNDATLSDLKVSGTTVAGFVKTTLSYSVQLPYGTAAVPPVTATTTDVNAARIIIPAASLPGNTTVQVTAEDGSTIRNYTISFTLALPSTDANLSNLLINGTTVPGFNSSTVLYDILLPYGTSSVPVVTAATSHAGATKIINPAASLPGVTSVIVTAQDGTTSKTYSVSFTVAKNNDATLSNLTVSGSTIPGFLKTTYSYSVQLPYGTTAVPTVVAVTTDANANRVITPAASLPGSTTIRVTAEDGTTILTYTISFTLSLPSSDASLSDLRVDGTTVPAFNSGSLSYDIVLPFGTLAVPVVTATASHAGATRTIYPAAALPGVTSVVVTAQDGTTSKTYYVYFSVAKNSDATLSNLTVAGSTVAGFVKTTLVYIVELPYGSTVVPEVTATPSDANATRVITPAASLPGVTAILVTAENGTTTKNYSVFFTLGTASNDATLSDLTVNGNTIPGFSASITYYNFTLPYGTTSVPTVTAVTTHPNATKEIIPTSLLPGSTRVVVTAQSGTVSNTYTVNFIVSKNFDASLSDLMVDGIIVSGFAETTLYYIVILPFGTTTIPVVTANPTDPNATRFITQAASIPGTATIQVTAEDGTTQKIYSVFFTLAKNADATLSSLFVNGSLIPNFDKSNLSYELVLPLETTTPPTIIAIPSDRNATSETTLPPALPGMAVIKVTAEDGITTLSYEVFMRYPLSGVEHPSYGENLLIYPNPNNGSFTLEYTSLAVNPLRVTIMDLTGRVILDRQYANLYRISEKVQLSLQQQGSYIVRIIDGLKVSYRKIIVE